MCSLFSKSTPLQHDRFQYHNLLYRPHAAVVDFFCVFCCIKPQTYRCVRLKQETSNTTFSSTNQHFPRPDCSRLDHKRRLWFIALETPQSTQHPLHVRHRFSDRLAAFFRQRFEKKQQNVSLCISLSLSLSLSLRSATNRCSHPL